MLRSRIRWPKEYTSLITDKSYKMLKEERGQAIVGYVLIAAFIAIAALSSLPALRDEITATFESLTTMLSDNNSAI